ncbi:MAG: AsmA family protein, partial [Parahaliea sp.]
MRRALLILIVAPLVLILAAALLVPVLLDEDRLLKVATEVLEQQTGATLTVNGSGELRLLPRIALRMKDAELALPGESQPDLSVGALDIGVRLLPLLSGEVRIDGLTLDHLLVNVPPAPELPSLDTSTLSDAELDAYYAARRQELQKAGESAGMALALPMALEVAK